MLGKWWALSGICGFVSVLLVPLGVFFWSWLEFGWSGLQ
jgi:hypothetical protein